MPEITDNPSRNVFQPVTLAGISFHNRILRSATDEGYGDAEGRPGNGLADFYERMAKGGVGGIITGLCGVTARGKAINHMIMLDRDEWIEDYKHIVSRVHQHNTPIILQLAHAGRQTTKKLAGGQPVSPSALRDRVFRIKPRALSGSEIEQIINDFANAVRRAKDAGFDGAQIHAAHGYLLSQFLSAYMNRRTDEWGGSTENRFRIMGRIIEAARRLVGDFPILVKINAHDNRRNGMRITEAVLIAQLLENAGYDAIEVSCGVAEDGFNLVRVPEAPVPAMLEFADEFRHLPRSLKKMAGKLIPYFAATLKPIENYNVPAAASIKEKVNIPVIVVGGIRKLTDIERILQQKSADLVAMARPFIIEPHIVKKFASGKSNESKCINCGYCLFGINQEPLRCYYGKIRKKR